MAPGMKWLRFSLAVVMTAAGGAKLAGRYEQEFLLPQWAHYLTGVFEVVVGISLTFGFVVWPASVIAAMCLTGLALSWWFPKSDCGCAGTWLRFSRSSHVLFAASVGAMASLLLVGETSSKRGASHHP